MDDSNGHIRTSRRIGSRKRKNQYFRKGSSIDDVTVEQSLDFLPSNRQTQSHGAQSTKNIDDDPSAGDGCFISAVRGSSRYYGILVNQSALQLASSLHLQDGAESLGLNRRMVNLRQNKGEEDEGEDEIQEKDCNNDNENKHKNSADVGGTDDHSTDMINCRKRNSSIISTISDDINSNRDRVGGNIGDTECRSVSHRTVQKFKYVNGRGEQKRKGEVSMTTTRTSEDSGYRILLATYVDVNAASEDDIERQSKILSACDSGGDWVGNYYYQYEVEISALRAITTTNNNENLHNLQEDESFRTSMNFTTFLQNVILPPWFPLCNIQCVGGTNKILKMFHMKNKGGKLIHDDTASTKEQEQELMHTTMKPRNNSSFRIGIIGGGLAGLSCANELLRKATQDDLNVEVVVMEAKDRVGGRLSTDETTFSTTTNNNKDDKNKGRVPFPVDLGAGWIHGISGNPLAELANEARIEMVTASEDVKMLRGNMSEVNSKIDSKIAEIFNDVLDRGARRCWKKDEYSYTNRTQKAIRWYALPLVDKSCSSPKKTDVPPHRYSSDASVDEYLGQALFKKSLSLSPLEQNLLLWNTKNTEYALGANICDLSMKYWDIDDVHAFHGAHVLLKGGFSALAKHLLQKCQQRGRESNRFKLHLNCPIREIHYAMNSSSYPYPKVPSSFKQTKSNVVNLSDTCRVVIGGDSSSSDTKVAQFDFLVCAVPLGVLKRSLSLQQKQQQNEGKTCVEKEEEDDDGISFYPPLPKTKRDSIENVGFGLLNKVYIQFPNAFWRMKEQTLNAKSVLSVTEVKDKEKSLISSPFLAKSQRSFGNASGLNPHHYMFFDVGRCMMKGDVQEEQEPPPAILLTLISGSEAVEAEKMLEKNLVDEIMSTLQHLFSEIQIPLPLAYKATHWGSDPHACGSYTFLPPGTSDEDYQILQSPINFSGDTISGNQDGASMRLFWAGEHTSRSFPSMAHGAYLSGIRAATDIFNNIIVPIEDKTSATIPTDKQLPITVYREKQPSIRIRCNLCKLPTRSKKEGALLAFQRGSRRVLVHTRCAEYSPEVEVWNNKWKNVIKAVHRGLQLKCKRCGDNGATIGCQENGCTASFHLKCTNGWDFMKYGKKFRCELHRPNEEVDVFGSSSSTGIYRDKHRKTESFCFFCLKNGNSPGTGFLGRLLEFSEGNTTILVHENCLRYTNILDIAPTITSKDDNRKKQHDYLAFEAFRRSKVCTACKIRGATIKCFVHHCNHHFHFSCLTDGGWDFDRPGTAFFCPLHATTTSGGLEYYSCIQSASSDHYITDNARSIALKVDPLLQKTRTSESVLLSHAVPASQDCVNVTFKRPIMHNLFSRGAKTLNGKDEDPIVSRSRATLHLPSNGQDMGKKESLAFDPRNVDESEDVNEQELTGSNRRFSFLRMIQSTNSS